MTFGDDFFDRYTDPQPESQDFFDRFDTGGQSFFDYALQKASDPISQIMGVMDPYGAPQSGAGQQGFGQDIFGSSGNTFLAGMQTLGARAKNSLASQNRAAASPGVIGGPGGVTGTVGQPSTTSTRIAQKITQTATRLGLDPTFALWVAEHEGGLDDAAANRRNVQGSQAYGPYQLLLGGGLGDEALKQGIDPRDANSWERQIEFALQHVAKNGWGAWEAVTARGIDPWTGTPRKGGYAAPQAATGGLPSPGALAAQMRQQAANPGGTQAAPGVTSSYAQHATVPASEYSIAFDFDRAYDNPWSPSIPRHRGVDIVVKGAPNGGRGSRVGAFVGGTVVAVTADSAGGNGVIIRTDDGLYNYYGHFDSIVAAEGQRVERGTPLGILGASGTEGFPHLHYEVRRGLNGDPMGQLIDPRPYLNGAR